VGQNLRWLMSDTQTEPTFSKPTSRKSRTRGWGKDARQTREGSVYSEVVGRERVRGKVTAMGRRTQTSARESSGIPFPSTGRMEQRRRSKRVPGGKTWFRSGFTRGEGRKNCRRIQTGLGGTAYPGPEKIGRKEKSLQKRLGCKGRAKRSTDRKETDCASRRLVGPQ